VRRCGGIAPPNPPEVKSRPKIGEAGELTVATDLKHAVEFAGDGMPAVVSTPSLVGFLERTARQVLAPHLDADERSVGIELDIRHLAPTAVGQTIHCAARVIAIEGTKISFQIEARDDHEVIVRGLHKRAVIRTDSFSKRVKAKGG
jgi:fluoroacetyl-CoA thioesterase